MAPVTDQKSLLIVSADTTLRQTLSVSALADGRFRVFDAPTPHAAISRLERDEIDIVIFDIEKTVQQEMDLVSYIRTRQPHVEIVILTGMLELDIATAALRSGASFYLVKPLAVPDFRAILGKLSVTVDRLQEHRDLEQRILADFVTGSPAMQKVLKLALKIAPTSSTILIGGESGTGKEFFARIIHRMSGKPAAPFIAMNCGAVPDTLFESELFGYKKGAFTGADRDKAGIVEEAHTGTLFLDEVGELSPSAQVKLLRFLQERTYRRVGDATQRTVQVRIIAASNRDLSTMVAMGTFREDLLYRLNVFTLHLPPLRERKETIPNMIRLFMHRFNEKNSKKVLHLSKTAEALLANYDFPGNVRELENIIEHAIVLAETSEITEKDLPESVFRDRLLLPSPAATISGDAAIVTLAEIEKNYIVHALALCADNYSETAKKLGISRSTLWRKIKEYDIKISGFVEDSPLKEVS